MTENKMREIKVEKVTLNIGAGKDQKMLDKGMILLKAITGIDPVKTLAKKRIPGWGLRQGLPIGCKITLRHEAAVVLLKRLLEANEFSLNDNQFDANGNFSFGIKEYIDIPGIDYIPEIGVIGLEASVTLMRSGYRVKTRRILRRRVGRHHAITQDEAKKYVREEFGVKFGDEE